MPTERWSTRNALRRARNRLRYPPLLYKKVGGINAVVIHADGTREDYGRVSTTYAKRWDTSAGQ